MAKFRKDEILKSKKSNYHIIIKDVIDNISQYEVIDIDTIKIYFEWQSIIDSNFDLLKGTKTSSLDQPLQIQAGYIPNISEWIEYAPEFMDVDYAKEECEHKDKYINHVFTSKFWICCNCKKDLGDA